jgi:hypothetical protein
MDGDSLSHIGNFIGFDPYPFPSIFPSTIFPSIFPYIPFILDKYVLYMYMYMSLYVYVYSSSQVCHHCSPGSEKVPLDQRSKVPLLIFGTAGMRCSGQPESHGNPEMGRCYL